MRDTLDRRVALTFRSRPSTAANSTNKITASSYTLFKVITSKEILEAETRLQPDTKMNMKMKNSSSSQN